MRYLQQLLLCVLSVALSACNGGDGKTSSDAPADPPFMSPPLPSSPTKKVEKIDGFDIYRLSSTKPKDNWTTGLWRKSTIESIVVDPSDTILRSDEFLDTLQEKVDIALKKLFKKDSTPTSDHFGVVIVSGNELTFGSADAKSELKIPIFLAKDGVFNIEKTGTVVEIKELKTTKGEINVKAGTLRIDTASLAARINVTGTGSLEFSKLSELEGEYLYQEIISDGDKIMAKDRPILNNVRWSIKNSLVEGNVVNKGTFIIDSSSRVFGSIQNSGSISAKDSSIGAFIKNEKEHEIVFRNMRMLGEIDNRGTFLVSGGDFSGNITNYGQFKLHSDAIPMRGDFTNEVGGIFFPKSANMSGILDNRGELILDAPMQVKSFRQNSNGKITVQLFDEQMKKGESYLQASDEIVISDGKIVFSYQGKAGVKKDAKYKILSSKLKAPVVELNIEYEKGNPIQAGVIDVAVVGQDYILTFLKDTKKKTKGVTWDPLFALSMKKGRSVVHSYLTKGMNADFHGTSVALKEGVSFTVREEKVVQDYTFMALHQKSCGVYVGYSLDQVDVGVYGVNTVGILNLTNNLHINKASKDLYGFTSYSELSVLHKINNIHLSPKVLSGYNNTISFEDEGTWFAGVGLDISSKFTLKAYPVEVFSAVYLITGDGQVAENVSHVKVGFKAELSDLSKFYGNIKFQAEGMSVIEAGLNLKINS